MGDVFGAIKWVADVIYFRSEFESEKVEVFGYVIKVLDSWSEKFYVFFWASGKWDADVVVEVYRMEFYTVMRYYYYVLAEAGVELSVRDGFIKWVLDEYKVNWK